jgi:hypothetical protein
MALWVTREHRPKVKLGGHAIYFTYTDSIRRPMRDCAEATLLRRGFVDFHICPHVPLSSASASHRHLLALFKIEKVRRKVDENCENLINKNHKFFVCLHGDKTYNSFVCGNTT